MFITINFYNLEKITLDTKPLFTIIIPIFNGENTLMPVLESIKNQTFGNFELILYDDASTDQSVELVKLSLKNYNRKFLFIKGKENKGTHFSVNECIKRSKGKYLCFCAQDNIFNHNRLDIVANVLLKNNKVNFVTHDYIIGSLKQFNMNKGYLTKGLVNFTRITLAKLLFFRSTLFALDSSTYLKKDLKNFSSLSKYSPIEDLALLVVNFFAKRDTNLSLKQAHINEALLYKIYSKKSQTFTKNSEINQKLIELINEQNLGYFLKNIILSSSNLITLARSHNLVSIFFKFTKSPIIFILGFIGSLVNLVVREILKSYISFDPNKFKSNIKINNKKQH